MKLKENTIAAHHQLMHEYANNVVTVDFDNDVALDEFIAIIESGKTLISHSETNLTVSQAWLLIILQKIDTSSILDMNTAKLITGNIFKDVFAGVKTLFKLGRVHSSKATKHVTNIKHNFNEVSHV